MSCRNCQLWNRKQAMDAAGRIRKDRVARCQWVSTEVYPVSITPHTNRPQTGYTAATDGEGCPTFVERTSA